MATTLNDKRLDTMMWNEGMNSSGWIVMTMAMVAFWALVVLGAVALFRRESTNQPPNVQPTERTPLGTLDERFARGEIDVDDYHARQEILRANR